MSDQSFSKNERLRSRKTISQLMSDGERLSESSFQVIYKTAVFEDARVKLAIAVPKRNFKKAVDRQLIKRRIREAYRKNKLQLIQALESSEKAINAMIMYKGHIIPEYSEVENNLVLLLNELKERHERSS